MAAENKRVEKLVKGIIQEASTILHEEETGNKNAEEAFALLDEARKSLQDAQAKLYMQMPSVYQQLYATQLATIYNHAHNAIAEVQKLAKQMHLETSI